MINKDMTIEEILKIKEDAAEIFMRFGMGCVGCPSAQGEYLDNAASIHGIDLDELLEALNK